LVPLTLFNFAVAAGIVSRRPHRPRAARILMAVGVAANLGVLGYFKYANFLVDNLNALLGTDLVMASVVLPLGISFFIFQKIAFVVDAYRGRVERLNFLDFSLFVSFFPQLIAGPIVHHSEVLPQFRRPGRVPAHDIAMGVTIFAIGLAKKVLLADTAALHATPGFAAAANGTALDMLTAWSAALSYTAQLYFDFSGYSDMAIGGALLFGIRLPINFASPYKAVSIIDFWRRWHMTLSRFLRDYLYIPLGGSRHGIWRRYANLMLTMLLGGLWHGAGWTYVIWGGLHGLYLLINHAWRALRGRFSWMPSTAGPMEIRLGQALTFMAVVVGWVFFRAADTGAAWVVLKAMAGANGVLLPSLADTAGSADGLLVAAALLLVAWLAPATQDLVGYGGLDGDAGNRLGTEAPAPAWQPTLRWAALVGCVIGICLMSLTAVSEFLYFQF
jgi:alginate O-acetyltransferase complex protein AlgI